MNSKPKIRRESISEYNRETNTWTPFHNLWEVSYPSCCYHCEQVEEQYFDTWPEALQFSLRVAGGYR